MMKSKEFIDKLTKVVKEYKTVYMWGTFGSAVKESLIQDKAVQYPEWYTEQRQYLFRKLLGKGYFAFDCVGLIKGTLWGWSGDKIKANGGATYISNGVVDTSANGMLKLLYDVSADFKNILMGEAVWMEGHIGIYIGEGKVIECTPIWENGCQITTCLNMKKNGIDGLKGRKWTKHGKLPWVEYEVEKPTVKPTQKVVLKTYTVKLGDSLGKIALANKTTVEALAKLNGIKDVNIIHVGQVIKFG